MAATQVGDLKGTSHRSCGEFKTVTDVEVDLGSKAALPGCFFSLRNKVVGKK